MTQEQYEQQTCPAVKGLPHTGSPEFDHLVDEIQEPEATEAFYEMAVRLTVDFERPEEWRAVPGFEQYEVSNLGRVRSWTSWKRGRLMALTPDPKGYIGVNLGAGNDRYRRVNRLVLEAFVRPAMPGQVCRHLDGDKTNNRVENLCWGSISENNFDIVRHGLHRNARKTHCLRGHEFTDENTYRDSKGSRQCRECTRIRHRDRYARNHAKAVRPEGVSG